MKNLLGVIGGSGFDEYADLVGCEKLFVDTPFGVSSGLLKGRLKKNDVVFIPRHGQDHSIAPHDINYRANIWSLKELGVSHVLAINAVGGIGEDLGPGVVAIPDQIIDYSYDRNHTFYSKQSTILLKENKNLKKFLRPNLDHVDFTFPYDMGWREFVLSVSRCSALEISQSNSPSNNRFCLVEEGVYGCTQGPRLETAAEIRRLKRDGCDMVGMTGMPEAGLARELSLPYACIAISVNWAAGLSDDQITLALIKSHLVSRMKDVKKIIEDLSAKIVDYSD
ncbi:MAG: S-methyl-5'-thioinosine phosphorylase [Cellvibrionaceae bacterium]